MPDEQPIPLGDGAEGARTESAGESPAAGTNAPDELDITSNTVPEPEPDGERTTATVPGAAQEAHELLPAEQIGASEAEPHAEPSDLPDLTATPPLLSSSSLEADVGPDQHPSEPAVEPSEEAPVPPTVELEELILPPSVQALEPIPAGTDVGPAHVRVERLAQQRGQVNFYLAFGDDGAGAPVPLQLREAPSDHPGLQREAEVLTQVRYAMLPRVYATWEGDGRRYLALDRVEGPTLADALAAGTPADQVVSITLQLAQVLRRLHGAGWTLPGLSPESVCMGQPIQVTDLSSAIKVGVQPACALQVPGYSAPELAQPAPLTGKEDVYTLGAMLYCGLSGHPPPEQGLETAAFEAEIRVPGAPQLIAGAVAPAWERIDLEELYRRLLAFKRRLATAPLALSVASGTSLGLNQTRVTNEDACGYFLWSSAYEGRAVQNGVLCVVDGMGGMEAGEVASTAALRAVLGGAAVYAVGEIGSAAGTDRDEGAEASSGDGSGAQRLDPRGLVQAAAEAVFTAGRGRSVGATITCAVLEDGQVTLGHVGDTRAYLLRDGVLTQLTRDHSLVAVMVASGVLTKEEARGHPESNKVLRSLGGQRSLPDEYVDSLAVAYGEEVLALRENDRLLLCSDGVWGQLADEVLSRILSESPDSETAVRMAIQQVLDAGAPDNASLIVARCHLMPAR